MKNEKDIRTSLKMHREALSYTKEQFKVRLTELAESGEIEFDLGDEETVERLFNEMRHIERAIIRELEWILEEELQHSEDWVKGVLDNL